MEDPGATACMAETFRRSSAERDDDRYRLLSVASAPLPVPGSAVGLRTTMQVDVSGRPVEVVVDEVFVAAGGWFGRLQLLGAYEPLDGADRLVEAFATRLASTPAPG